MVGPLFPRQEEAKDWSKFKLKEKLNGHNFLVLVQIKYTKHNLDCLQSKRNVTEQEKEN